MAVRMHRRRFHWGDGPCQYAGEAGSENTQMIGVKPTDTVPTDVDAIVVALKTRTSPPATAVKQSLAALRWLGSAGSRQFYFKYCSTFDSTADGNIGPVAEALMEDLGVPFTVACPAFPENGRTIYQGYLFVGNVPLNESSMRHHPLTPMTDSNLCRVLRRQVSHDVGLVDLVTVSQGAEAIRQRLSALAEQRFGFAILDALTEMDLRALGEACSSLELVTGGSGLASGLAWDMRRRGLLKNVGTVADALPTASGLRAVVSGSCSAATQEQVAAMRQQHPSFEIDLASLESGHAVQVAIEWAARHIAKEPILIYSTSTPDGVKAIQARFGAQTASHLIEGALAEIASALVDRLGSAN